VTDDTPAPEASPLPRDPVDTAVTEYAERRSELERVTAHYVAAVTTLLDDAGVNYLSVTGRTKSVASFAGKAHKFRLTDPDRDAAELITDQVGVRVVTYLLSDVTAVAGILSDELQVLDDRDLGRETADEGRFGYSSRHLLVTGAEGLDETLAGHPASVQVRTVLQHAWAEIEHDIRYKGTLPVEYASEMDRHFTLAAGLLELADREFAEISERIQSSTQTYRTDEDANDPRIDDRDLTAFLSRQYPDAGWSRTDHYSWISGLLLELGITSLDELAGLLISVDSAAITTRMGYKHPSGGVRRLDDALLAVFGRTYVDLHGNSHRVAKLTARLEKLRGEG